jgi:hypothetical protein
MHYDTMLRSMEETIIFNVGTSYKTENIYSMSFFCVLVLQIMIMKLQVTVFWNMTMCSVIVRIYQTAWHNVREDSILHRYLWALYLTQYETGVLISLAQFQLDL